MTHLVVHHGVYAVFVLMAIDAVFPAAGELVMLVGGALATRAFTAHASAFGIALAKGSSTYVAVAAAGTLGYFAGALVGWWVGRHFAQTLREQPVRLLHLTPARVARAEAWFARWGAAGVFVGRVVPLVRSFVSVPAGALGMRALPYALLTLPGAAVWSFALAAAGWAAGAGYHRVDHAWRYVEAAVAASLALVVVRAWRGWRGRRTR